MMTRIKLSVFVAVMALFTLTSCLKDDPWTDWSQLKSPIELPYSSHFLRKTRVKVGDQVTFDLMVNYTIPDQKNMVEDIPVELAVDANLIDSFNDYYGTSYQLLPSSCYTMPEVIIKKGVRLWEQDFVVNTAGLEAGKRYILPIIIKSVPSNYLISGNFGVVYLRIDMAA